MAIKNLLLLFVTSSLIIACGGGSGSKKNDTYIEIVAADTSQYEGQKGQLSISTNIQGPYQLTWQQVSGPKTYFTENGNLSFILPNVIEDEKVVFRASALTSENKSFYSDITIDVKNYIPPTLTEMPKPNVFSDPNYKKHETRNFDSAGIPLVTRDSGDYYYTVASAAYGYDLYKALYKSYQSSGNYDEEVFNKLIIIADWLKNNCIYTEYGFCSYRNNFEYEAYKLTTDWISAMGQGQALSVLLAAHYLTGDESYANVAFDAVAAFQYPLEVKGLSTNFDGHLWYEEYGSEEMPVHVLNGFIFALSGLYDMHRHYDDSFSKNAFDIGVASLVHNIPNYDWNFTSRYSYGPLFQLASTLSGPDAYHELHIFQLTWLYGVTGEQTLKDYAELFLSQDMAGIKFIEKFYENSQKIMNVEASSTINSINFGADRVYDGYWSIRDYWSSYRFPVDLRITLNEDALSAGEIQKLVLTSTTPEDFPTSFSLIQVSEDEGEVVIKENITLNDSVVSEYVHQVDVHKSYTVTFDISTPITSSDIIIRIDNTQEGLVRLREVDFHYQRDSLLQEIIDFYSVL